MTLLRRVACLLSAAVVSVLVGQGSASAQPPGAIAAGEYHNTSQEASFSAFGAAQGNLSVFVVNSVRLAAPKDAPSTTTQTTSVFISTIAFPLFFSGCYHIAPSDFTFSAGAAALHTTITSGTGTCGGPPGNFPTPFTVDATWTANGPVSNTRNESHFDCGGSAVERTSTSAVQAAGAVATLTPMFSNPFTAPQNQLLRSDDDRIHAEGVTPDGCQPAGGIPGGAGPPSAGGYRTTSTNVGFFIFSSTGPSVGVFVTNMTQQSNPMDAPATTTTQFDVRINVFGGGTFGGGCFVLSPSDFSSSGVQGATLNMTITATTPACTGGGPGNLQLPLTVHVVWTGTSPVASFRTAAEFDCLTYRNEGQSLNMTNLANVTATLTPLVSGTLTTDQGSLATSDGHLHAEGVKQPACHL